MKSINKFKNDQRTTSVYSDTTKFTNIQFANGQLVADFSTMTGGKKLLNFDHDFEITQVRLITNVGKSGMAISIFKGASAAANIIAKVSAAASNTATVNTTFNPDNAKIVRGGYLTVCLSGAATTWASMITGRLIFETKPV